jgi:hypothetical protein
MPCLSPPQAAAYPYTDVIHGDGHNCGNPTPNDSLSAQELNFSRLRIRRRTIRDEMWALSYTENTRDATLASPVLSDGNDHVKFEITDAGR